MAAMVPVVLNICLVGFPDMLEKNFNTFFTLMENNEFICGNNYQFAANYIPSFLYLTVIGCMLVSLAAVCETYLELFAQALLLALGLATRVIMGFTPTIYVSKERTFLYLYMILGISSVYLFLNNRTLFQEKKKNYDTLKLAGVMVVAANVLLTFTEIGSV